MINLNSGDNYVCLTLFENSSGSTQSYYTFNLKNKSTKVNYYFTSDELSGYPYYWNKFLITLGTVSGATAGLINYPGGEYTYNIYETTSRYDLGLTSSLGIVETGICILKGTHSTISNYNPTGATISSYGYNQT